MPRSDGSSTALSGCQEASVFQVVCRYSLPVGGDAAVSNYAGEVRHGCKRLLLSEVTGMHMST